MRRFFLLLLLLTTSLGAAWAQGHVIDSSFAQTGWTSFMQAERLRLLRDCVGMPDGKVVVTGEFANASWGGVPATMRLTQDGRLDSTFSGDGIIIDSFAVVLSGMMAVDKQSTGKVVVGGYGKDCSPQWSCTTVFTLFRYDQNGERDSTFGTDGMVQTYPSDGGGSLLDLLVMPDDRILAVGYWSAQPSGNPNVHLVRYLANGDIDSTFGTNGLVYVAVGTGEDFGRALALQPDGKIIVAGYAETNSDKDALVLRFLPDGTLDQSFGGGDGIFTLPFSVSSEELMAVCMLPDGKIFLTGQTFQNNTTAELDLRLNADGTLDTGFHGIGYISRQLFTIPYNNTSARAVFAQPDGKVVIGGYFTDGGSIQGMVQRLDAAGNLDPTFNGSGYDTLAHGSDYIQYLGMCLQPDGRIACVGSFQFYAMITQRFLVARYLNRDLMAQVTEGNATMELEVWPNPVRDHARVRWTDAGPARVTLVDGAGRILEEQFLEGEATVLDLSRMASGSYWMIVQGAERVGAARMVKD